MEKKKEKPKSQGLEMWGVFSQQEDDDERAKIMEAYVPEGSDEDVLNVDILHEQ